MTSSLSFDRSCSVLRVHRIKKSCEVLGPGKRAVVWFQGCALDCPGCIAAEMNRSTAYSAYSPSELADAILELPDIEGVTLSGGDPFDQPLDDLLQFLTILRAVSKLTVMCYTGRTMHELRRHGESLLIGRLMNIMDILIDGRYVEEKNDGVLWRGSSNQRVYFLSRTYRHLAELIHRRKSRALEIELTGTQQLMVSGIPQRGFLDTLSRRLSERGFELTMRDSSENTSRDFV